MPEFRTEVGKAVLLCERMTVESRYRLHLNGAKAVLIELLDRPHRLECSDTIQVIFKDARSLQCHVFDDTPMCTVVGDGFLRYLL